MISAVEYPDHPYVAMFPLLSGKPFDDLVEDIRQNGQRVPCVRYEGRTIDGRNRIRACVQSGIIPAFVEWEPSDSGGDVDTQILEFIVSVNLHRRQLSASQRAAISVEYYDKTKGKFGAEARWAKRGPADERTGKLFAVSPGFVKRASKLKRRRPDLFVEVAAGRLSVEKADNEEKRSRKGTCAADLRRRSTRRGHLLSVWRLMLERDREEFTEFESVWEAMADAVDSVQDVPNVTQYDDRRDDESGPQTDLERDSRMDLMAERIAAGLPAKECYAS